MVAGGQALGAQMAGFLRQEGELDALVAPDAGVGRASPSVFPAEILDNLLLKFLAEVEDIMRYAQAGRNAMGVLDRPPSAAAPGAPPRALAPVSGVQVHSQADHAAPPFQEKGGRHGGIYAPAHGHGDKLFFHGSIE